MKLLIDMNLSPEWVPLLKDAGWEAVHWSTIGRPNAPDHEILGYARSNQYVIFTHDLDFGSILAATKANCPSVIQIRTQDVTPKYLGRLVVSALHQFEKHLEGGALVTVNEKKLRARVLPFEPQWQAHSPSTGGGPGGSQNPPGRGRILIENDIFDFK